MTYLIPLAAFALFAFVVYHLFIRKARTPNATPDGISGGYASTDEPPAKEAPVMQASVTQTPAAKPSTQRPRKPRAR